MIQLSLKSNNGSGFRVLPTTTSIKRFIVKKKAANYFNIQANDNDDADWHDLDLDIKGSGSIKFTIENSGIACD